jgi:hypothetical protein
MFPCHYWGQERQTSVHIPTKSPHCGDLLGVRLEMESWGVGGSRRDEGGTMCLQKGELWKRQGQRYVVSHFPCPGGTRGTAVLS